MLWASVCSMSRPSINHMSSLCPILKTSLAASGHLKRCFSSRLCQRQKPFRSQYKIFKIFRRRLQNTNRCPENGSSSMLLCTRIDRPLIDLRISVMPTARYTFIPGGGNSIIIHPKCGSGLKEYRGRILPQFQFDSGCQ